MSRVLLLYLAMVSQPAGISADALLLTRYIEIGHVGKLVQSTRFTSEHLNHVTLYCSRTPYSGALLLLQSPYRLRMASGDYRPRFWLW
jgi:hypothetical protein